MHKIKCYYCGEIFDRDKEPSAIVKQGKDRCRYAHLHCEEKAQQEAELLLQQEIELKKYIMKLFNMEFLPTDISKQIDIYIEKNDFTFDGILKALKFFYEVQNGDIEQAQRRIGIVPFIYDQAQRYYAGIKETQDKLSQIDITSYFEPSIEVHIPPPQRTTMGKLKKNSFNFLESEEKLNDK